MRKSLKIGLVVLLCSLLISGCPGRIDLEKFNESEEVEEIINRNRVGLIDETGDNLIRGNGSIAGLNPNRYYAMEELDDNDNFFNRYFIMAAGTRSTDLGYIGRVTGGLIPSLNNQHTYIVSAASSLFGNSTQLTYFDLSDGAVPAALPVAKATVTNGVITISAPAERYYLDLAPAIDPTKNYEIMMIPIDPSNRALAWNFVSRASIYNTTGGTITAINTASFTTSNPSKLSGIYQFRESTIPAYLKGMSLIELWGTNTIADYVFIERNTAREIINFNVLRVIIGDPAKEPDIPDPLPDPNPDPFVTFTLNIVINYTIDGTPVLNASNIIYSQLTENGTISINIISPELYSGFRWYFNEVQVGTNSYLTLDIDEYDFLLIAGNHVLTVEAVRDGIPYSRSIPVTVTE